MSQINIRVYKAGVCPTEVAFRSKGLKGLGNLRALKCSNMILIEDHVDFNTNDSFLLSSSVTNRK